MALADPRAESLPESALGIFRLDLALPELKYGAEYNGVAFHSSDGQRQADRGRSEWLADAGWVIEEFWKDDLYGPHAHPITKLRAGVQRAHAHLGVWQHPGLGL